MPGHVKSQAMPGFLGDSDLAVPVTSVEQGARGRLDQGLHLDQLGEGSAGEGQHPERHQPVRHQRQRAGGAAQLVVPTAKHWVDVENGNILRNMLAQILTGKLSVKQAAQSANDNIVSVLNQS